MSAGFTWRDGERTIVFGRGALARAGELLGDAPYALLMTPRGRDAAPDVVAGAAAVHEVGPGLVDELAGDLLGAVEHEHVVALGGGRVIDVAKAIVAARRDQAGGGASHAGGAPGGGPAWRVAAIPTTLSAAEMTAVHRRARGTDGAVAGVRPALVLNDPALSASQPEPELAASAANALAHAAEGRATTQASPVPSLAGAEAARLIGAAYAGAEPDRDALALAALLSGYTIDSGWYGLHHVLSQTLVRLGGAGHGPANAAMLPHTLGALALRDAPGAAELVDLARDLAWRAGASRLRDVGVAEECLDACADAAAQRPELHLTPPRADRDELRGLYAAAW